MQPSTTKLRSSIPVDAQMGDRIDATAMARPTFATVANGPNARHVDGTTVADQEALYIQLKQWLLVANLELVVESLRRAAGASVKISWNAGLFLRFGWSPDAAQLEAIQNRLR